MSARYGAPPEVYRERCDRFAEERDRCAARQRIVGRLRVLTFLAAIALLTWATEADTLELAAGVGAVVLLFVFVGLVAHFRKVERERQRCEALIALNREGLARLRRDWDALAADVPEAASKAGPGFADDLDLFGRGSLFGLLGTVGAPGRETLAGWLLEPAAPETIARRQAAVAELAPRIELREVMALGGRGMAQARAATLEGFLRWAEGDPWLLRRPAVLWTARLLPLAPLTLIALNVAGVVSYATWAFALAGTVLYSRLFVKRIHRTFDEAFAREGGFQKYAELIGLLEAEEFEAPLLRDIRGRLAVDGPPADSEMRKLHRLVSLSEIRLSMMYWAFQGLMLWDFHVLARLERWQERAGPHVREWLGAVAEADALAALAALRFDQPDWAFPEIVAERPARFVATGLGHPLLPDDTRVTNDIAIPPPGRFLFLTGSNMSGKSTLLRAVGTNAVLALAGGPVCAASMRLSPISLATSMRVQDSLLAGLSHFMAELERLKGVVEAARRAGDRALLYLLDDILQGTNSEERRIAARRVIRHLLKEHAIGCVTSHDLALAEGDGLAAAADAVHFTERIAADGDGASIAFDYRLRPGVATSRNALKLVELIGLGDPPSD